MKIVAETSAACATLFACIALFSYLPLLFPPSAEYSAALIAAVSIYLPVFLLRRKGESVTAFRVAWPHSMRPPVTLVVAAVVFPAFSVGFFAYQNLLHGSQACIEPERLAGWPEALSPLTDNADWPDAVTVASTLQGGIVIRNGTSHPVVLNMIVKPPNVSGNFFSVEQRRRPQLVIARPDGTMTATLGSREMLVLSFPAGPAKFEIVEAITDTGATRRSNQQRSYGKLEIDDQKMNVQLLEGEHNRVQLPYRAKKGYLWLLTSLLVQVLLIALPEEIFYRGYLQTRLAKLGLPRVEVLGGDVGPAVLITSVVFAASHLIATPSPSRLSVFFPSVLFGWLRDRTGSVAGPVVLHALSNILLALLWKMVC